MPLIATPAASDADAYATLAEADAYHAAIGNATWTGTDAAKEAAIRRATQWLDGRYRGSFPGLPVRGRLQALEWPRSDVSDINEFAVPSDAIPREIVAATAEAALRELVTPNSLTPDYVAASAVTREKVGPLEVQYSETGGSASVRPIVTVIDEILSGLFRVSSGGNVHLVRA